MRGYVRFSVSGRYPERFINITARNSVRIWDVHRRGDGFTACMYMSDYRRIKSLARSAGVILKVTEKRGLPTYAVRYRDRVGVVIGACAFILSIFVMSLFIWSIDITGLDTVSRSDMLTMLRENGLYVGAFKPSLDYQDVARAVMLEHREIGWMAVNVTGSYASVEIKEEAPAPEVTDVSQPCNVKARRDGVILSIEAMQGDKVLTEGSGVVAGQLVVSGVMGDELGGVRLVHADARIIAQTKREVSFSTGEVAAALRPDGEEAERRSVCILGLRIPYRMADVASPYSVCSEVTEVPAPLDICLPIARVTETVSALTRVERKLNDRSAEELLQRQAQLYELFSLADCEVIERDSRLTHKDGVYTLSVAYTCVEDIAYSEPIGTDENTDLTRYIVEPTEAD